MPPDDAVRPPRPDAPADLVTLPVAVLRGLLRPVPVALLLVDPDGTIRLALGGALRRSQEELVGESLIELAADEDQVRALRAALAGEPSRHLREWSGRQWDVSLTPLAHGGAISGVAALLVPVSADTEATLARLDAQAVLEAADEAIVVLDRHGTVVTANARCRELFGSRARTGTSLPALLDDRAQDMIRTMLDRRVQGLTDRYELPITHRDGSRTWLLVSGSPLRDEDGLVQGSVAVCTDITAQKQLEERLQAAVLTDELTGVASRATLTDRLAHALAKRGEGIVAVLFCDVDELKATNDRLGHAAGDALLRHVAQQTAAALRPADTVARFGGDEFVVVCEELHSAQDAVHLGERIRAAVARTLSLEGSELPTTVSIGVATSPPYRSADDLLAAADAAAYAAKRAGRNAVHLADG